MPFRTQILGIYLPLWGLATPVTFPKANSTVTSMFYFSRTIRPITTSAFPDRCHLQLGPKSDRWVDGPKKEGEATFSCPMNQGAVLCLPMQAKRMDTVARADFGKLIIRNIDHWFAWARQLGLEINCMDGIVLVTGTHRTRSWTNVAFTGGQEDTQASFEVKMDYRGDIVNLNWQSSHERNQGAVAQAASGVMIDHSNSMQLTLILNIGPTNASFAHMRRLRRLLLHIASSTIRVSSTWTGPEALGKFTPKGKGGIEWGLLSDDLRDLYTDDQYLRPGEVENSEVKSCEGVRLKWGNVSEKVVDGRKSAETRHAVNTG
ncbi:hypothetical protein BJY52DRAFT_1227368 [Lactarius psammicola]|nr:hypothetical protein BJY52DRAFT_1227368 [Lactarius psammicola]